MKTYSKVVSEKTVVVGGQDNLGAKADFLQVEEECNNGQNYFRVYFLTKTDGQPLKTFHSKEEAVDACRKSIRPLKVPVSHVNLRYFIFEL
jgi:hypothetical protein